MHSDLMSIIYRAQRSRQFYVERFIDISQEKSLVRSRRELWEKSEHDFFAGG